MNSTSVFLDLEYPKEKGTIWELYQQQKRLFWTEDSISFTQDIEDLKKLSKDEKKSIAFILVFFKTADSLVIENITKGFISMFDSEVIKMCYNFQITMEYIHQIVYNKTLQIYCSNDPEFNEYTKEAEIIIEQKIKWITDLIDTNLSLEERLVYFVCVEGLLFASAFATIAWFKLKNVLPGLTLSNEFIQRDESIHTIFGIELYKSLDSFGITRTLNKDKIIEIIKTTAEMEKRIITLGYSSLELTTINKNNMILYVEYISNYICNQLEVPIIYEISENPLSYMTQYSLNFKSNFFEKTNSIYKFDDKKIDFNDFLKSLNQD